MKNKQHKNSFYDWLWEAWCIASVIGIWPRHIEPNLLSTTHLKLHIPQLDPALKKLKILQLSDLHLNRKITTRFLNKLLYRIELLKPDIIVFTGDFLCYSKITDRDRLLNFLNRIPKAPYGNFAILGNHDYQEYVSLNENGDYDIEVHQGGPPSIGKGFRRLLSSVKISGKITSSAKAIPLHSELIDLLKETSFQLLHNETITININGGKLNICGLGEYTLGRLDPKKAFSNYDKNHLGIILAHNPDSVPHLMDCPGEIILCGHTHGGQINLPWIWKKFVLLENMQYKRGLVLAEGGRRVYVNRGLAGIVSFRWFCLPELLLLELEP